MLSSFMSGREVGQPCLSPDDRSFGAAPHRDTSEAFMPYSQRIVDAVVARGEEMARNAGTARSPQFNSDRTGMDLSVSAKPVPDTVNVVFESAGSHIGAAVWVCHANGNLTNHPLFDVRYIDFAAGLPSQTGFQRVLEFSMAASLVRLRGLGINPKRVTGMAEVWSNAMQAQKMSGPVGGLTGRVVRLPGGTSYRKDGDLSADGCVHDMDIGQSFLDAAAQVGMHPVAHAIGNDTSLVAKAAGRPVHTAGVISTGANELILVIMPDGTRLFCSGEVGNLELTDMFPANSPEFLYSEKLVLEDFIAKGNLGDRLAARIIAMADEGGTPWQAIGPLANYLRENHECRLTADDVELLSKRPHYLDGFLGRHPELTGVLEGVQPDQLWWPAIFTTNQAGSLAGKMLYLGLFSQLADLKDQKATLALDSRVARDYPGYWDAAQVSLRGQLAKHGVQAEVLLLEPKIFKDGNSGAEVGVSVPMRGGNNLLYEYQ